MSKSFLSFTGSVLNYLELNNITRSRQKNSNLNLIAMEHFKDVNEVKGLLDKVLIQTLELMEEDITLKINIEKLTNEGTLNFAKTR